MVEKIDAYFPEIVFVSVVMCFNLWLGKMYLLHYALEIVPLYSMSVNYGTMVPFWKVFFFGESQYLDVVLYLNIQSEQSALLCHCFTKLWLIKFPFILLFSQKTRINLGNNGQIDVHAQNCWFTPKPKQKSMTFYSVDWGVARQCLYQITAACKKWLLEKQMMGDPKGGSRRLHTTGW